MPNIEILRFIKVVSEGAFNPCISTGNLNQNELLVTFFQATFTKTITKRLNHI